MRKLLHERLRDIESFDEITLDDDMTFLSLDGIQATLLADEIEHYYIPRPRYENGEPVEWGDKDIEWDGIDFSDYVFNGVRDDGMPLALGGARICSEAKMTDDGFVVRKKPKILDSLERIKADREMPKFAYQETYGVVDVDAHLLARAIALAERGAK